MKVLRLVLLMGAMGAAVGAAQHFPFSGAVDVNRMVVEVRVLDSFSRPIPGLVADDFVVRLDGEPARVEAVEWLSSGSSTGSGVVGETRKDRGHDRAGRTLVLLFQTDLHAVRLKGLMRMILRADELLARFVPGDRVAVAVFGSHLELHTDFTDDIDALRRQLTIRGILASVPPPARTEGLSLAAVLDHDQARDAASLGQALQVLGEALESVPGSKSIILLGWGIGRYTREGVRLGASYRRAAAALSRARTSVFVLDVTDADYHSLQVGLQAAARDTGGLYEKTHLFPDLALERIANSIEGRWEVVVETTPMPAGAQVRLDVEVNRDGAVVLAPRFVTTRTF